LAYQLTQFAKLEIERRKSNATTPVAFRIL
jgi:hypothetical protein